MESRIVNDLDLLLKGEHMAINAYERFIHEAGDENVRSELQSIQNDHRKHAADLEQRLQALGGKPDKGTGFAGVMASVTGTVQSLKRRDDMDVLRNAYDGEDKGIAAAEKLAKDGLDEESKRIVSTMLSDDHDHLKKMTDMMSEQGNRG